jgi:glycerol-3-phosphate acyltransferase PlsY
MSLKRRIAITLGSYLLGGISTGYYLVKLKTGEDIRSTGSGSSGARNVGRSLGTTAYVVTAAGDMAKGALIPAMARRMGGSPDSASVAAVAGHVWPAQMGFRGGRGLTVAFGAVMTTEPRVGIAALSLAGTILPFSRNFTTAGLIATALAPVIARLLQSPASSIRSISGMAAIVLTGHRHYLRQAFRRAPAEGDET